VEEAASHLGARLLEAMDDVATREAVMEDSGWSKWRRDWAKSAVLMVGGK
jgi:hypothetical protein